MRYLRRERGGSASGGSVVQGLKGRAVTFLKGFAETDALPGPSRKVARVLLASIFIAGTFLALLTAFQLRGHPVMMGKPYVQGFDEFKFNALAERIAESGDWTLAEGAWDGRHNLRYEPLYVYFLAGVYRVAPGDGPFVAKLLQALMGALLVLVVYYLAEAVFSRWVALLAAFVTAFYGFFLLFQNMLLKDFPATFLSALFLLAVVKLADKRGLAAWCGLGAFAGFTNLLKANLLLPPLLLWMFFYLGRRMKAWHVLVRAGCVLLFTGLLLSPVALYNMRGSSPAIMYSQGVHSFWIGNAPGAGGMGIMSGLDSARTLREHSRGSMKKALSLFREALSEYPEFYARLFGRKWKMFWNAFEVPVGVSIYKMRDYPSPLRMPLFGAGHVMPLAMVGMALGLFAGPKSRFLALVAVFFIAGVMLFMVNARYRMPIMPIMIIFASFALYRTAGLLFSKRFVHVVLLLVCVAFAVGFTRADLTCDGYYEEALFAGGTPWWLYDNFAQFSLLVISDTGRYGAMSAERREFLAERSIMCLEEAIARAPRSPDLHLRMARFLEMKGDLLGAAEHYVECLKLDPDNTVARQRLLFMYRMSHAVSERK